MQLLGFYVNVIPRGYFNPPYNVSGKNGFVFHLLIIFKNGFQPLRNDNYSKLFKPDVASYPCRKLVVAGGHGLGGSSSCFGCWHRDRDSCQAEAFGNCQTRLQLTLVSLEGRGWMTLPNCLPQTVVGKITKQHLGERLAVGFRRAHDGIWLARVLYVLASLFTYNIKSSMPVMVQKVCAYTCYCT